MFTTFLKTLIVGTPLEKPTRILLGRNNLEFTTSQEYWDQRYQQGGTSGAGSYGRLAKFKAEVINDFVESKGVNTVVEFGAGDGNQLLLARYPSYLGVDVSTTAVLACAKRFEQDSTKKFVTLDDYDGQQGDLVLSLDVVYHLVEDSTYEVYMKTLFEASKKYVIIYSSNKNDHSSSPHVRHRKFTDWVSVNKPDTKLLQRIPNAFPFDPKNPDNTSFSDFYIFENYH